MLTNRFKKIVANSFAVAVVTASAASHIIAPDDDKAKLYLEDKGYDSVIPDGEGDRFFNACYHRGVLSRRYHVSTKDGGDAKTVELCFSPVFGVHAPAV